MPVKSRRPDAFGAIVGCQAFDSASARAALAPHQRRHAVHPHSVRWHDTARLAAECDMRLAVEMPPGAVLTKLGIAALPQVLCVAADGMRVDSVTALIRRERGAG